MANKFEVKVYYSKELIAVIQNDNPSFDSLASYFIKKDPIEYGLIKVECENDSFDKAALEEAIREAIKEFFAAISSNKKKYDETIKNYSSQKGVD